MVLIWKEWVFHQTLKFHSMFGIAPDRTHS